MKKILIITLILSAFLFGGCQLLPKKEANKTGPVKPSDVGQETNPESLPAKEETDKEVGEGEISLQILSPTDKSTVSEPKIVVLGKTKALAEVTINENEMKADQSGNFSYNLNLEEGENYIIVTVSDEEGNYREKELMVNYQPAE